MLDIKFVRENQDLVAQAMANRNAKWDAEKFAELDEARRASIAEEEALQAKRNAASKEIGKLMGQGKKEEAEAIKEEVNALKGQLEAASAKREEVDAALKTILMSTPNIPHETTPIGKDENDNPEVRR